MNRDFFQIVKKGRGGVRIARVDENDALRKIVGKRFKLARELNGWSQEVAAAKLDYVNSTQLSLAEKGERLPPLVKIVKASEVFGVSVDYLMGITDEPERDPRMAERNAAMRQVTGLMEGTARTIVTTLLSIQGGGPSVTSTRNLTDRAEKMIQAVENLRAANLKTFDEDMRGAATVIRTLDELQAEVMNAKAALDRHDQVIDLAIRTAEDRAGIVRPLFDEAQQG